MNKLQEYILDNYSGNGHWFEEEVQRYWHINRVNDALDNKAYLNGKHKIKQRQDEVYKEKVFETRKIALNYANTLLEFEVAFLLKNPVTLISNDLDTLELYKKVYREGKYHNIDYKILKQMVEVGEVYEYVYIDENGRIKSMLFNAEDSYPVYDHTGEMIGFIHYYIFDGVSYYTIYTDDVVYEYNDKGGDLHLTGEYSNLSGMVIPYILPDKEDELRGKASFRKYLDEIDNLEDLISKYIDSYYKFLDPVNVFYGTKLNAKDGSIDASQVGHAIQMPEYAKFDIITGKMDYQTFNSAWKELKQSMLDNSRTPAISMNSQEVSNLSETSIRMMYSLAEIQGSINAMYLKEGFEKRWGKIKKLLRKLGHEVNEDAYIDCNFNMNIPQNEGEIIENLSKATGGQAIMSVERAIEVNPYTIDVNSEIEKLGKVDVEE